MAVTHTPTGLAKNAVGDEDWADAIIADIDILDALLSKTTTVNSTGGAASLVSADGVNDAGKCLKVLTTGVLASILSVTLPARPKLWIIQNANTGAFATQFTVGASTIQVGQGSTVIAYTDGTTLSIIADASAVADGSITTAKLATGAVTNTKLGDGAVAGDKIAAGGLSDIAKFTAALLRTLRYPFDQLFFSTGTPAPNVSGSAAHGMTEEDGTTAAAPFAGALILWCQAPDGGYAVNDQVQVSGNAVYSLFWDTTNVYWQTTGVAAQIPRKDTGVLFSINPGSWFIQARVWQ